MVALGVLINDRLTATDHVSSLLESCSRLLVCIARIARPWTAVVVNAWCIPINRPCQAAVLCTSLGRSLLRSWSRKTWCILAQMQEIAILWRHFANHHWLVSRCRRLLFESILANSEHILHNYIPERASYRPSHHRHHLRPRKHSKELIPKTRKLYDKDFIVRMLYKGMY